MTLLQDIVDIKKSEVARRKARVPHEQILAAVADAPPTRGFARALSGTDRPAVIAEVKRASPSRGVLRPLPPGGVWRPENLAKAYEAGGARALSVLTDTPFFWGSDDALGACREATALPVLRKDFIVDAYQIAESRWLGADCVLLIARLLAPDVLAAFAAEALALGMDALVEVHDAQELDAAIAAPGTLIGVNNRDLDTLTVDPERALAFREKAPADRLLVAESGIASAEVIARYRQAGVHAFLIGEHLACSEDPTERLRALGA